MPQIHRPIPRRNFDLTPVSTESSGPSSPSNEEQNPELVMKDRTERSPPPSRTRSILNLTSSTLLGIYSGATDGSQQEMNTPWGTGAQTPAQSHRTSFDAGRLQVPTFPFNEGSARRPTIQKTSKRTVKNYYMPLVFQTVMLFVFGIGFGSLLTHVHHTQSITAIPVPKDTSSRYYQIAWGLMGVVIGNALPQLDLFFENDEAVAEDYDNKPKPYQHIRTTSSSSRTEREPSLADNGLGPIWHSAVRSIGAFVGIAFALVRSLFLRHNDPIAADYGAEKDSVAVHTASVFNLGRSRSDFVVLDRSLEAWSRPLIHS